MLPTQIILKVGSRKASSTSLAFDPLVELGLIRIGLAVSLCRKCGVSGIEKSQGISQRRYWSSSSN